MYPFSINMSRDNALEYKGGEENMPLPLML
jgi:hypothetical protein